MPFPLGRVFLFGVMPLGSNDVFGTTVSGISKFCTVTIAGRTELLVLILEVRESAGDPGIVEGNYFSLSPSSPDVKQPFGFVHYSALHVDVADCPSGGAFEF